MIKVAVTMRITEVADYHEPRDSISHDWLNILPAWGMTPLPVPNIGNEAVSYLDFLKPDLLILSGGDDIGTTPARDETEYALLRKALSTGLPVFGVCRGLQLINTFFGGTIAEVSGHVAKSHTVNITTEWRSFFASETIVNSFHNRCIPADSLAADLHATAYDTTGNIEGFRHTEKPLAAVMWHPERNEAPKGDYALVQSLIGLRGTN
ncbi:gamma-glutamyl-gamma-aminobutyrate hydrolase family protein [Rhodospirillales bacterium]|nr:gamma-glutamyl-gamma-aminobutyrate hydrolase family protein [Rhodospirillales bacterium]